jgi:hypothetical protein
MPRQDVPYGGALCRLKERIAEIWDKLGEKLHSINGVEGDGAGNVKIVSGDAAVVITSDQVNHQIEVALDSSQLPAASVSSVNGQTGAVALTADDVPSNNGDVQTDLDNLTTADTTLQGNINAEALARQNADSALQTNINTVSASLPAAAAAAVAADPTVAQLTNDVSALQAADGQNVKLSGSQNITGTKTVPTQATGTYSQQIANSTKIKNELDNYTPMVRTSGNQTIAGNKIFTGMTQTKGLGLMEGTVTLAANTWTRILTFTDGRHVMKLLGLNVNGFGTSDIAMFWPSGSQVNRCGAISTSTMQTNLNMITIFNITDGLYELWGKQSNPNAIYIYSNYSDGAAVTIDGVTTSPSEPQADNITYKQKVTLQ